MLSFRFYNPAVWAIVVFLLASATFAQELREKQQGVAERYAQLEQVLLRMSEATATSNPRRAELLKKVLLASKDKLVALRLDTLAETLQRRQLTEAISGQEGVEKDLLELLKLLESENRDQRRQLEKEKIKEFLRDLEEIIHQEKALKARTAQEESEKIQPLEKPQRDVRLRAQALRDRIDENDRPTDDRPDVDKSSDEKPADEKDENSPEEKTGDENPQKDQSSENDSKTPDDGKKKPENEQREKAETADKEGTEQEKAENKGESKNTESAEDSQEKNDAKEDSDASPTQQAMKKAMQRMRQAEQKLRETEKSGALEEQEEAIAELQRVKAELEKILRQLREEEVLQTLEKLELRFKRMLKIEQSIRTQSEKLTVARRSETPDERQIRIQSSRISADQQSVIADADAALVLLREDGTAQAMVESLLQTRFDMEEIKGRLDRVQLDAVTLEIEDAVIAALQEMLEAIDMAIKEAEKRKENPPPDTPPGGDGQEDVEPLIQALSELRMIRSMQQRVNDRTQRCDKAVEELRNDPNADFEALRKTVEELARQQNRISRILHEIKIGKTR